ncbi:hypothetical protein WJX81_006667 [Elliptochloris bilobata]|uniref:S-adenosyl-L-methionine-dependent methyltransferase n=1 Tax=Elliptochloris bilobata TaxID=381761 RepID=A0AAW1RS66_9CHLO
MAEAAQPAAPATQPVLSEAKPVHRRDDGRKPALYHRKVGRGPCGIFRCVGNHRPTNYMILCQRPFNRDCKLPNCNEDFISPMFRDHVMPARVFWYNTFFYIYKTIYAWAVEEAMGAHGMINYVDARTSYMDGLVVIAAAQSIDQVVVIASGYCTRAYRLHRAGVKFFEVDLPPVVERKIGLVDAVLPDKEKYPRPAYVPTDLADVGALAGNLAGAGFDASRPALFTCEGIFCYLPQAVVDCVVAQVSEIAAPGSRLCLDLIPRGLLEGRVRPSRGFVNGRDALAARGEPLLSGFDTSPEDFAAYWRPHGWAVVELLDARALAAKQLPHLKWSDRKPPLLDFMHFAELRKE